MSDLDDIRAERKKADARTRQFDAMRRSLAVDRRGWTRQQWIDDARALMDDPDGAVTSLVNGHVMAMLDEVDERAAAHAGVALAAGDAQTREQALAAAERWLAKRGPDLLADETGTALEDFLAVVLPVPPTFKPSQGWLDRAIGAFRDACAGADLATDDGLGRCVAAAIFEVMRPAALAATGDTAPDEPSYSISHAWSCSHTDCERTCTFTEVVEDEQWQCEHVTRCADSVCSFNPAMQRWIRGQATPTPPDAPAPVAGDAETRAAEVLAEKFTPPYAGRNPAWDIEKPDGPDNEYHLTAPMAERVQSGMYVHFTDTDGGRSFRAATCEEAAGALAAAGLLAVLPSGDGNVGGSDEAAAAAT